LGQVFSREFVEGDCAGAERGGKDKGWFPWHDTEVCVEGPAAWDYWTAFEQHWRHQLSEHVDQLLRLDQVRFEAIGLTTMPTNVDWIVSCIPAH
jgi:phosphatidylserine/phosphatidylglycerophosphate/cardiolipin synthase-like enzyme